MKSTNFRHWVQQIWLENRDEHQAFNEPELSQEEYFARYKYWLKREYQYQKRMNKTEDKPKVTLEFAPGAFDNFEGTQEELDEFVAEIQRLVDSGELMERAVPVDFDDLDEEDEEMIARIVDVEPRNLQ